MELTPAKTNRCELAYRLLAFAVGLWTFGWTYICGQRGLFISDQTVVFDAGWRILCGQVPFKDFFMGPGVLAPAIEAVFLRLLGVNWTSMVISSATVGLLAALSTMRIIRLYFGFDRRGLALLGGLLVGSFFQAIFGTLVWEEAAFLFTLFGIQAVGESLRCQGWKVCAWQAAAGVCGVLSFLGKQNAGALTLAMLALVLALAAWSRRGELMQSAVAYGAGVGAAAAFFTLWLFIYSNPSAFWHYAVVNMANARRGLLLAPRNFLLPSFLNNVGIVQQSVPSSVTPWCHAFALGAASLAVCRALFEPTAQVRFKTDARFRIALALTAAVPFLQAAFQVTTAQEVRNGLFLSGLSLTLGWGLALELTSSAATRRWLAATACAVAGFLLVDGLRCAWFRQEHLIFTQHPASGAKLQVPGMEGLTWMEPTQLWTDSSAEVRALDIEEVAHYLAGKNEKFFVFGDSSFLYGVLRQPSQSPLLYFQPGAYYTRADIPGLDRETVSSLERNGVRLVVREKFSFFNRPERPEKPEDSFPLTKAWIAQNFIPGPVFGNYEILLHK